jgi:hypothetical protein
MDCAGTSTLGTAKPAEASPAVSSAGQKIEAAPGEVDLMNLLINAKQDEND